MNQEEELLNKILQDLELFKKKELLHNKLDQSFTYNAEDRKNEEIRKVGRAARIEKDFQEKIENVEKLKTLKKENVSIDQKLELLEDRLLQKLQTTQTQQQNPQELVIFDNLDKYFEQYIEHILNHEKKSPHTAKAKRASYRYLKYFSNRDTTFNFSFFKQLQKNLQQVPSNFFKFERLYKSSFEQVLKITKKENLETLNPKTINDHMSNFYGFFNYLIYEELIQENPLEHIKSLLTSNETIKEEYTEEELEKIFNSGMEQIYLNMCKTALYLGLRIEEVLSIKKQDIKDNLVTINIEDKTTKKHTRIIPIHKNLQISIKQQIKSSRNEFLFFDGNNLKEVKNVGKRVNRRIQKIVPSKIKTFHSLRKNFSQEIELNTQAEEKVKKYLMAHSFKKDVTHMVYNRGKVNIEKLRECINQITFNF